MESPAVARPRKKMTSRQSSATCERPASAASGSVSAVAMLTPCTRAPSLVVRSRTYAQDRFWRWRRDVRPSVATCVPLEKACHPEEARRRTRVFLRSRDEALAHAYGTAPTLSGNLSTCMRYSTFGRTGPERLNGLHGLQSPGRSPASIRRQWPPDRPARARPRRQFFRHLDQLQPGPQRGHPGRGHQPLATAHPSSPPRAATPSTTSSTAPSSRATSPPEPSWRTSTAS